MMWRFETPPKPAIEPTGVKSKMKSFDLLKQANRIVAGLIKDKTPPVFETCVKAYEMLGDLAEYAKMAGDEEVSAKFAQGIGAVIAKLEPLRVVRGDPPGEERKMKSDEFATFFKDQVEKALAEEPAQALSRLHAVKSCIEKAVSSYESASDDTVSTYYFVDPWQQASVAREGDGAPVVTSGRAQAGEVKATPGISIDDVLKSTTTTVEKARNDALENFGFGWSTDLASPEFLKGERKIDFGRDGTK